MMKTLLGRCLKCGIRRDVPTSLKTRVFVCPQCGREGPLTYNNLFVVWLKTFLLNGFWGVVFIGIAVVGVIYYPRVIGQYADEKSHQQEIGPKPSVGKEQP